MSRNGFWDRYWWRVGQLLANFFPVPTNSPRSLCECKLVPVSFSFLKWRIAQLMWRVVSFSFRRRAYGTLNVRSLLDVREQYLNEFSFPDPYAEVMTQADSSTMNFRLRLSWSDVFSIRIVLSLSGGPPQSGKTSHFRHVRFSFD